MDTDEGLGGFAGQVLGLNRNSVFTRDKRDFHTERNLRFRHIHSDCVSPDADMADKGVVPGDSPDNDGKRTGQKVLGR